MANQDKAAHWIARTDGPALEDVTLGDLLDRQAAQFGNRPAVVTHNTERETVTTWTYRELKENADRLARGLMAIGVARGDHVAVMSPNGPEWLLLEYALAKLGAVLVTVNPGYREAELRYLLTQGRISHLVFTAAYRRHDIAAMLSNLMPDLATATPDTDRTAKEFPDLRRLVLIGEGSAPFALPFATLMETGVSQEDLASRQATVSPDDVMQIQYTSGTTGSPKGAMLTHHSTINNARLMGARAGFRSDDVLLSAMPFFHTAGCVCNVMGMLAVGGCLVTMDAFEPGKMLDLWEKHGATVINAVPTMYSRMLDHPDFAARKTDTLRLANTGGTSIPPSLMRALKDKTGARPMIIMGMTECSPIITETDPADDFETQISTAGTPLPHTELKIVDPETGATVAFGDSGELCIRGYLVTKGYFDMPEKTADSIDAEGWLHSGDLAVLTESGHLSIVGRLKDMIIRGGENVYPVEIEDFLLAHPEISQAQVVGCPDPDLGEEVFAFVLLRPGARLTGADVQAHCRANLARHKMPKFVEIVTEFPTTPNGKIQKFALRDMAARIVKERETA